MLDEVGQLAFDAVKSVRPKTDRSRALVEKYKSGIQAIAREIRTQTAGKPTRKPHGRRE